MPKTFETFRSIALAEGFVLVAHQRIGRSNTLGYIGVGITVAEAVG